MKKIFLLSRTCFTCFLFTVFSGTAFAQDPVSTTTTTTTTTTVSTTTSTTTAHEAPPEMPVYEQPACPTEGYLWTPGYWAFGPLGFYWVPGVWVSPPTPGYLWTPGYWGFEGGVYGWHVGYWGEHIGYYGGVCYGYGYGGHGYDGGRWEGGSFRYNTAVNHVDVTIIHNTYEDKTVVHNNTDVNRSSFNGVGGVKAEPTPQERVAMKETHINQTPAQSQHILAAKNDKSAYASENHGKPATPAMNKPGGQHFSPEGKPAQHSSMPVNAPAHANAPLNNSGNGPHSMAPANNSNQHAANAPANNGQHAAMTNNEGQQQHTAPVNRAAPNNNVQHPAAANNRQYPAGNSQHPNSKTVAAKPAPAASPKPAAKKRKIE